VITDDDRRKALEYEQWITEILKQRSPPSRKRWWEAVGLVSAITAVLTVGVTTVGGYFSQSALRREELRGRLNSEEYQQEVLVLQRAHSLATESAHYAAERYNIRTGRYDQLGPQQKQVLVDSVNAADTHWRQGRDMHRVGLELQFGEAAPVLQAWDALALKMDRYATCTVHEPTPECGLMHGPVDSAITAFRHFAVDYIRQRRNR